MSVPVQSGFSVRFGNRRDGAINPHPSKTAEEIWETHHKDWQRLHKEEGLYVWQVQPSYRFVTVRAHILKAELSEEDARKKIESVLGETYGSVLIRFEKPERDGTGKKNEGCCGNQCMGCNNGNPKKRLYVLG